MNKFYRNTSELLHLKFLFTVILCVDNIVIIKTNNCNICFAKFINLRRLCLRKREKHPSVAVRGTGFRFTPNIGCRSLLKTVTSYNNISILPP